MSDFPGHVRVFPTHADGQDAGSVPAVAYPFVDATGIAEFGGKLYMTERASGGVVVPVRVYDETIGVLRRAVDAARLANDDRLAAVRRLDEQARLLERVADGPSLDALVAVERRASPALGGRTVRRSLPDLRD